MSNVPVLIDGMQGFGDNFYQRAILREYAKSRETYLITSWPELYADTRIGCIRPSNITLRTQSKNVNRDHCWAKMPRVAKRMKWHYVRSTGTMLQGLMDSLQFQLEEIDFSGPSVKKQAIIDRPYVIVRPASVRKEWSSASRNPDPEYIAQAAAELRSKGYFVISIADFEAGHEDPVLPLPDADLRFHEGQIFGDQLLSLVAGATCVVGGVGWMVPASIAYQVPMLLIYGGWGFHNGPQRILDKRLNADNLFQVLPENFCMCSSSQHNCDKRISEFGEKLGRFISEISG